jgi:glycosyltransferase involved in cell wall biosynthesis
MKISVVIPTLNRRNSLEKVLHDFREQSYKNFEVLILDGGSTDGTKALCDSFKRFFEIRFYLQKSPGIVGAMNEALIYCTGDIFIRTDDDVVISKEWLSEIVNTFFKYPDAGGVTGPTIIPAERLDNRDLTFFNLKITQSKSLFWKLFRAVYHGYFMEGTPFAVSRFFKSGAFSLGSNYETCLALKEIIEVDYLESCNWSVKLDLIRKIGRFDNRYGGVSEYFEADAVYKIKRLGYKMYFNPKARIQHLVERSGNFKARAGTYGRAHNFILFYLKHIKPDTLDKAIRFSLYLVLINLYFVYCFVKQQQIRQLSGIAGTVVSLFKYSPGLFRKK